MSLENDLDRLKDEQEFRDHAKLSIARLIELWHDNMKEPKENIADLLARLYSHYENSFEWTGETFFRVEYADGLIPRIITEYGLAPADDAEADRLAHDLIAAVSANENYRNDRKLNRDRDALTKAFSPQLPPNYKDPVEHLQNLSGRELVEYLAQNLTLSRARLISSLKRERIPVPKFLLASGTAEPAEIGGVTDERDKTAWLAEVAEIGWAFGKKKLSREDGIRRAIELVIAEAQERDKDFNPLSTSGTRENLIAFMLKLSNMAKLFDVNERKLKDTLLGFEIIKFAQGQHRKFKLAELFPEFK
jgi:hypothetical protein